MIRLTAIACASALAHVAALSTQASTNFIGASGGSVTSPGNWDNGVPTLANVGGLLGSSVAAYNDDEDLNGMAFDISGNASLTGGDAKTENVQITIRDTGNWSATGDIVVGEQGSSTGSQVLIRDSGSLQSSRDLDVGNEQVGLVDLTGGSVNVGRDFSIGTDGAGSGSSYGQSAGNLTVNRHASVANASSLKIDGGTANITGRLDLEDAGSTFAQSGGTTTIGGATRLRRDTAADISGGEVNFGGQLRVDRDASVNVSSGTVNAANDIRLAQNGATMTQTGGIVTVDGNLDLDGGSNKTYALAGGALAVEGTIIVTGSNNFEWRDGGTLTTHPNFSVVNFDGDLTADTGARFRVNSGTDQLNVFADLTINDLTIDGYGATLPAYNGTVQTGQSTLLTAANINGTAADIAFSGMSGLTLINAGDPFDPNTDSVYWLTVTNNFVAVNWSLAGAAVPEPDSLALLVVGLTILTRRRRR